MTPRAPFFLTAQGIEVTYALEKILQHISMELSSGTIVGISGASGSGKSTLLRVLAAIQKPDAGHVYVRHHEQEFPLNLADSVLVPQKTILLEHATVLENCLVPLMAHSIDNIAWWSEQAELLLERVELIHTKDQPAQLLSGGQQQRLAWVRAALLRGRLVCLDEPTAHLDAHSSSLCMPFLRHMSTPDNLIILASHDPQLLDACDRVYHLSHGLISHA